MRRGRGPWRSSAAARTPGAPVDLTGTWVSVVTEDWQWRMRTPAKGDTTSVPLNAEGRKVADAWEPSMDGRCEAHGVGGIMRMPTRLKISWQDDLTLKIETDAGQQTRLLQFARPGAPLPSAARHVTHAAGHVGCRMAAERRRVRRVPRARRRRGAPRWGALKVTTTNMLPGWLRRNGVPTVRTRRSRNTSAR